MKEPTHLFVYLTYNFSFYIYFYYSFFLETHSSEVLIVESDGGGISEGSVYDINDCAEVLSDQWTTENPNKVWFFNRNLNK